MSIAVGSALNILNNGLELTTLCGRWIPHLLTPKQQVKRVEFAIEFLKNANCDTRKLSELLTGAGTWVYQSDMSYLWFGRIFYKQRLTRNQTRSVIAKL